MVGEEEARSALVVSQAIEEDRVRHPVVVGVVSDLVGAEMMVELLVVILFSGESPVGRQKIG